MTRCACGRPAIQRLYVRYRYPRVRWAPDAMDPFYVHGGGCRIETCGNPQCEPDAFLACRERIATRGMTVGQAAELELIAMLRPGDGVFCADDD
jgi:hypothetical protein